MSQNCSTTFSGKGNFCNSGTSPVLVLQRTCQSCQDAFGSNVAFESQPDIPLSFIDPKASWQLWHLCRTSGATLDSRLRLQADSWVCWLQGLRDQHPRVRWAACQALGQMCTDLGPDIQVCCCLISSSAYRISRAMWAAFQIPCLLQILTEFCGLSFQHTLCLQLHAVSLPIESKLPEACPSRWQHHLQVSCSVPNL